MEQAPDGFPTRRTTSMGARADCVGCPCLQRSGYRLELRQRRGQVFDDVPCDDLWHGRIVQVIEGLAALPRVVHIDPVGGDEFVDDLQHGDEAPGTRPCLPRA